MSTPPPPPADDDDRAGLGNLKWVLLILVGVAAFIGFVILDARDITKVSEAAGALHIAPFTPQQPDTQLERLGRDLARDIAATLAQVRDVHPVGDSAAARYLVHGTISRNVDGLRFALALDPAGPRGYRARFLVQGSDSNYAQLSDSLSRAVLAKIWRGHNMPAPALTTVP